MGRTTKRMSNEKGRADTPLYACSPKDKLVSPMGHSVGDVPAAIQINHALGYAVARTVKGLCQQQHQRGQGAEARR